MRAFLCSCMVAVVLPVATQVPDAALKKAMADVIPSAESPSPSDGYPHV